MPRVARIRLAGGIYQMITRGVERRRIYVEGADYARYLNLLGGVVRGYGWNVLAFCLMPNHVHILIETPEPNISEGMHLLHTRYVRYFNDKYRRVGPLFQDRPKTPLVKGEAALVRVVGYIALNPVEASLAKRPEDWPWSSHAALTSAAGPPHWLAHDRLEALLEEITGTRCYFRLVETYRADRY
jgi:putative transposase